ncbi:MAG: hypothetical protein JEZ07_19670 [Phycisphaerae bacterium]|nr:hypothetical protein [Phycisphaerae bacterium]
MAAPRGSSDSGNSMMVVVVVFVVLFLLATVGAITAFMKVGDLTTRAESAETELNKYASANELRVLKTLIQGTTSQTVTTQVQSMIREQASIIAGPDMKELDLVTAHKTARERIEQLFAEDTDLVAAFGGQLDVTQLKEQGLTFTIEQLVAAYNKQQSDMGNQIDTKQSELDQALASLKETQGALAEHKELLASRGNAVAQLQLASDSEMGNSLNKYEETVTQLNNDIQKLNTDKAEQVAAYTQLQKDYNLTFTHLQELEKQLANTRPTPDMEIETRQIDGQIVRVVPNQKQVYIDLTAKDPIFVGLTFSVYDSFTGLGKDGKGKATIEIIEINDKVTVCRITESDDGNPIMEKDVIANLIWDKKKKYNFCVSGDFDFDGDGEIDLDGYKQVTDLIVAWGGKVTNSLDVDTDFLILGHEPKLPAIPTNVTSADKVEKYNKVKARYDLYQHANERGAFLSVPTFNLARFINFIGYSEASRL